MIPFNATSPAADAGANRALELWDESARPSAVRRPDLAVILSTARRRAALVATVALIVGALFAIGCRLVFSQYVATATILFDPRSAKVTATDEVLPDIGPDSIAVESLVQVARSDGFLASLVEREGLAERPDFGGGAASAAERKEAAIEKLRDRMTIARRGATYVVDVSVRTADAQQSAAIANAAAAMVVESETGLRSGSNQRAADFIAGKLKQLRDRVSDEDAAIARMRTELKITDAGQSEDLQARRVTELSQEVALADSRSNEAKALVDQLREANFTAGALPSAIQSAVLSGLRADYARLTREAADRETVLGARHPDVIATQAQLGDVRRQIAAEKDRLVASAKADYLEARKREASLADELRKAQAESGATDERAVALRDLERTEKADQAVYEQLLDRQRALSEMKGMTAEEIRIVSPAVAPTRTNMPRWPFVAAAATLIGLAAGVGAAVARETRRRPPPAAGAATPRAAAPVADAILPRFARAPFRDGRPPDRDSAPWFERLCETGPLGGCAGGGVVVVTSPRGGEGKSTVAANVAACFARSGAEALLIQTAAGAGVSARRREGLVEVADGSRPLEEAILWFGDGAPSILPFGGAGASESGRDATPSGAAFLRVVQESLRSFDVLVIDAPSATATPALRPLARRADAILMVLEWDRTEPEAAADAIARFDARKLAVVLNKVDLARYEGPAKSAPAPAAVTGGTPVARRRDAPEEAGRTGWTGRTRRRRSAFDRED